MAFVFRDRVLVTSTTTGTGNFTVSTAVTGFQTFASACSVGDTFFYTIEHQTANEWETGFGTYSSANTLTRTDVLASSNSNSAVSFSSGTKNVFISRTTADAGYKNPWPYSKFKASQYYFATGNTNFVPSALAPNILRFNRVVVPEPITFTKIGIGVVTASSIIRFGLYAGRTNGEGPGLLLADSGTITPAAAGDYEATVSLALAPGVYWVAANVGDSVVSVRVTGTQLNVRSTYTGTASLISVSQTAGDPLPNDVSGTTFTLESGAVPAIYLRV